MKVVNFATVSVVATGNGTEIFSVDQARIATSEGLEAIVVEPTVDIMLIDAGGAQITSAIPGAVAGTVANSPLRCPAGVPTVALHRSGPMRAISSSGTATVKVAAVEAP